MTALIDTNVLVRFLIGEQGTKYIGLSDFFESLENGSIRVELKLIVLFQTIFVLNSYYSVPKDKIADSILDLVSFRGIRIRDKKTVQQAIVTWKETNLEIVDCYLIACLKNDAQHLLYSYDQDFDKFGICRKEP